MRFKEFVLNEQKQYLAQKVGDILSASQELRDDAKNMGSRDLSRFSERIVNQIRRVLHSYWSKENQIYLKDLQKIGVALMKSIKEKGDLEQVVSGVAGALESLVAKMGSPINKIASPDGAKTIEKEEPGSNGTEKTVQSYVKDQYKPPEEPKDIEKDPNSSTPINKDPQLTDQKPLGGNSNQQLSAM